MSNETYPYLEQLGVLPQDLQTLAQVPRSEAVRLLEALKERVRRNWKRLAFQLHPDRTGNDPQKTAHFQRLTEVREKFEQVELLPEPVPTAVYSYTSAQAPYSPGVVFNRVPRPTRPTGVNVGRVASNMKP